MAVREINLLTIGNSFSENALRYLGDIADGCDQVRLNIDRASLGGCSLEKHWNLHLCSERIAEVKPYARLKDGVNERRSLREILGSRKWDFVTLQQVSHRSWRDDTYQPFLGHLHGLVRELAPQAEILLHRTWAYRADAPYFPENGITPAIMHRRIGEAYAKYAAEFGCRIIPAGVAVDAARQEKPFSFPDMNYDYQKTQAPALPDQADSLAVGWRWAYEQTPDGIPALGADYIHLNERGCYLIGALWFEFLTGIPAGESSFVPSEIPPEDITFLQRIASQTLASQRPRPLLR